jgi:bifunctional non-homologous end joining protein LigD
LPGIAAAALKNRHRQFVSDGEAAVLGVDGISDFDALYSRKHNDESNCRLRRSRDGPRRFGFPAALDAQGELARLLHQRPDGIFLGGLEQGEIGPKLFRTACLLGLEGLVSNAATCLIGVAV